MTDAFAEFGVERRPWLDPDTLLSRYHELATLRHPDKCGGDPLPLSRLNEARRTLLDPSLRIPHLLILTGASGRAAKNFAPDFELFSQVGRLTRKAERVSEPEALRLQSELAPLVDRIQARIHALHEKLRSLDACWPDLDPQELHVLAEEFSFLQKWQQSLRAARTRLLGG